jgi:hypothetical protein
MGHHRVTQERAKANNLVAKHARQYNLAHTFTDRKAKAKGGHVKHKGQWK